MTPLLTVLDLEKFYGARRVLDGISFTVNRGDRIGIVGLNGSGKSTLMRVIVTEASSSDPDDKPDHGEIRRARGLSLVYVPQEPALDADATVEDVLRAGQALHAATHARLAALEEALHTLTGDTLDDALHEQATLHERLARLGGWDVSHELRAIHTDFGLAPLDARIGDLSGGERRRTAIAQALLGHPDLLALDEPTNHLDLAAVAWLEGWLANRVDALLLVTHDRRFLDRVATRILELDRGKIHAYEGNYTAFLEKQAERLANEAVREEKRAAFVKRELDWIRRGPAARTTKQQARIDRFEDAVSARPDHRERPPDAGGPTLRLPPGPRLGKTVVETRKLCRKQGDRPLVKDLDFKLAAGERVGIVGPNGAGKTTLLRLLMGQLAPDKGEVVIGVNTRFAFLDQGRTDLDDTKTVLEEVADGNDWVVLPDQNVHVRTFLRWLLFDDRAADTRIGRLSGGERNRVLLARLLRKGGNVLVLDEPTNDLDLQTLSVLEEALAEFPGCVLVVSHDRWFLDKVATSILAFEGDGRVVRHEGNFSYWLEKGGDALRATWTGRDARPKEGAASGLVAASASASGGGGGGGGGAPPATPPPAPAPGRRKLSYKEKKELEGMESAILAAEERVAALDAELADPATYRALGGDGIRARATELEGLRAEVERLYARWAELEASA